MPIWWELVDFPLFFPKRFCILRILLVVILQVTPGRKWPEWVAYRRRRGLLGIPGHLPVVYGGVGPVHPVVIVDFVRILAELIKTRLYTFVRDETVAGLPSFIMHIRRTEVARSCLVSVWFN